MYNVVTMPLAEKDIMQNAEYLYFEKQASQAAMQIMRGIRKVINELSFMPTRYRVVGDAVLSDLRVRRCFFKRYNIFFRVETEEKKVYILRALHMSVDLNTISRTVGL